MCWALVLGYIVTCWSFLRTEHAHSEPLTNSNSIVNYWGAEFRPQLDLVDPQVAHGRGHFAAKAHNTWLHVGIGAVITAALQYSALRWASWPFMPVGFLMSCTWQADAAWFSLLLGWLAKVIIVRFGGASLFQKA